MIRTRWIAGAALASMAAAGIAFAAPAADRPAPPKTRAEVQNRIAEHFKKIDGNADGFVTKAEADTARETMKAKSAERRTERRAQHFAMLDTDKNGALSKEEFTAPRERGGHDRAGRDGERRGHHDGWMKHRGGHGGMHGMRLGGGQWFDRADANKDGKVSLAEASAGALTMFDRIDSNKDGTISPEEHKAARDAKRAKWMERRGDATKG